MDDTTVVLDPSRFRHFRGNAWEIDAGSLFPGRSFDDPLNEWRLTENGGELGPSHTSARDIDLFGGGRFAAWGDRLVMSTSDNSDPTRNGRTYALSMVRMAPDSPALPKTAHVGITSACNLTCVICRSAEHSNYTLSDAVLDRVTEEVIPHLRWLRLDVSGEPTLHRAKFFRLIEAAERHGVSVFLCTNATLIDQEMARRICANRAMKQIQISMDSADRKRLEWVRQGLSYDDFLAGVRLLVDGREAGGRQDLRFHFHAALLRDTIDDLPDLMRFAHKVGVERVSAYFGFIQTFMDPDLSVFWDPRRHDDRIDEAAEIGRKLGIDFLSWGRFASQASQTGQPRQAPKPCQYVYQWTYISPDGKVGPCCISPTFILGDLATTSFADIWHGQPYRDLRRTHNTASPTNAKCAACYLESDWDTSRYQPFFADVHWPAVEARLRRESAGT